MSSIKNGTRGMVSSNIQTSSGMVYKGTKVKVEEVVSSDRVRVRDEVGRVLWVKSSNIIVY